MTNHQPVREANRIIAEFMGWKLTTLNWKEGYRHFELSIKYGEECYVSADGKFAKGNGSSFKYHSNWNELMPVVEKICRMESKPPHTHSVCDNFLRTFGMVSDDTGEIMVRFNLMGLHSAHTLIEATYNAVIEFIQWYNSQTPDNGKD